MQTGPGECETIASTTCPPVCVDGTLEKSHSVTQTGHFVYPSPTDHKQIGGSRLNTAVVQQVIIPVPAPKVQDEILARWKRSAAKVDALTAEAEKFIDLSHERRSALITAAVTGQIDVRDQVA